MSRSTLQKNQTKSGSLLSSEDPLPGLRKACLIRKNYEELLSSWIERGRKGWLPAEMDAGREWRASFVRKLKGYKERRWFREIVETEKKTPAEWDWLSEADGDPLMFLNLAGVPPLAILCELEYWKVQHDTLNRLRERLRSKSTWQQDVKDLNKASHLLDYYKPLLNCYLGLVNYSIYRGPDGNSVKAVADMIQEAQRIGLTLPGAANKGGPPKVEFPVLVRSLVWLTITKGKMPDEWKLDLSKLKKGERQRILKESEEPNRKIQWAAITALLWAAFPKWFDRDGNPIVNPIRSVKYAFKSPLNKKAHRWWSLVVRGKPAKAETYASIVFPEED